MKLSFEQIKEITTGAVGVQEEDSNLLFKRFTKEQEQLYKAKYEPFYERTFCPAGIKLLFKTDSKNLFIKLKTICLGTRKYFSVDVFVNGKPVGYIDNFSDTELPDYYAYLGFPNGDFSKNIELGEGEKTVCVHLPWSVKTLIEEISLDDNAFIEAVKPKKKLLVYGDSITQGYDALRPSNRYIAKIAELLDAEEYNKAIGGEQFYPELAKLKDSICPDYITVAYGTNDWNDNNINEDIFKSRCKDFYTNLSENYPDAKIFAITPIWRKDLNDFRTLGDFRKVDEYIRSVLKVFKNIKVISGFGFVPEDEKYFADLRLHPNDAGFECYAEQLYKEIIS